VNGEQNLPWKTFLKYLTQLVIFLENSTAKVYKSSHKHTEYMNEISEDLGDLGWKYFYNRIHYYGQFDLKSFNVNIY